MEKKKSMRVTISELKEFLYNFAYSGHDHFKKLLMNAVSKRPEMNKATTLAHRSFAFTPEIGY